MDGNQNSPFVFISYAHKDREKVIPLIQRMKEKGIQLWYDEGIEAGSEWPDFLARKLLNCRCFVLFISNAYLNSNHCQREMNYAINKEKDILSVYLEKVDLTPGMELQLGMYQAIFRNRFNSEEEFYTSFCQEPFFKPCLVNETKKEGAPTSNKNDFHSDFHQKHVPVDQTVALNKAISACNEALRLKKNPNFFKYKNDLTTRQIDNSIRSISKNSIQENEIIAVFDDTIFDSAKSGYLVTKDRFFSAGVLLDTFSFSLEELRSVSSTGNSHLILTFSDGSSKDYYFNNYYSSLLIFFETYLKERGF